MRSVTPLQNKHKQFVKYKEPLRSRPEPVQYSTHDLNPIYLSSEYSEPVFADTQLTYRQAGLPIKRFIQLKKGQIPLQARLDLHGQSVERAAEALRSFISGQTSQGNRCLLIIHGKGGHHGEVPIIKSYINHWLKQFPEVLSFHSALPRDGGTGAVYVLLKRTRDNLYSNPK
ncbi:Smr/MutS family protein [Legionella yabuuchiae]|uniref:Smr/MutS family protein n=1 Tax=Legionella yabuuchiae TaxID=376727 RepID=UPI0030FE8FE5